jgi:hypothetical protein
VNESETFETSETSDVHDYDEEESEFAVRIAVRRKPDKSEDEDTRGPHCTPT